MTGAIKRHSDRTTMGRLNAEKSPVNSAAVGTLAGVPLGVWRVIVP